MSRHQIYGFTGLPEQGEQYVRFVMAFKVDGGIEIHVRNGTGDINVCLLPDEEAIKLAMALNEEAE
jgi:hypothetical protein